ncbi:hypothetical protein FBY35_6150 [Streptomyces sp. SLBN-118]|nr:hypothetical protein FBY35_6150 [Streptomyces sp. SLBN-118]
MRVAVVRLLPEGMGVLIQLPRRERNVMRNTLTDHVRLRSRPLGRAAVSRYRPSGVTTMPASAHLLLSALSKQVPGPGPLTSEPPLADAAPLTSEPPLAEAAPLTSEPTAPGTAGGTESPGV